MWAKSGLILDADPPGLPASTSMPIDSLWISSFKCKSVYQMVDDLLLFRLNTVYRKKCGNIVKFA
jgi:hypothetical protein